MKSKHIIAYLEQCGIIGKLSSCLRTKRKVGAILVDPVNNIIISSGYNGFLRGQAEHCGGDGVCLRNKENIVSGERIEIGCLHAEENALINACRQGTSTVGAWLFVNCEPCLMCSRLMIQAGIVKAIIQPIGYTENGIHFLKKYGVEIEIRI